MKTAFGAELLPWARAQRPSLTSSHVPPAALVGPTIVLGRWPQSLPGRAPHCRRHSWEAVRNPVRWATLPALRPLLSILVLLVLAYPASAAGSASVDYWRVNVHEVCSYKLLPGAGVALTTKLTLRNARGGRSTAVHVIPGWNIGRLYPKAETALLVRLGPGQIARRVVTRTIPSAPRLWQQLKAGGIKCASTFTYDVQ